MVRSATWDITSRCNLKCKHCYNGEEYFNSRISELPLDKCYKIIDFLKNNNYKNIYFLGGEPLLHKDISKIIRYANDSGISTMITTNGLNIDENILEELTCSGLKQLYISIEGYNKSLNDAIRGTGTYDAVIEKLKIIQDFRKRNNKINIGISHTLTKYNINYLPQMVGFCKEFCIQNINVFPIMKSGEAKNNWNETSLNIELFINNLEKMAECICVNYPILSVIIEARPIVATYLALKYPGNFNYSLGYTKCMVDYKYLYIQPNGEVHPCGLYKMECGKELTQNGALIFNHKNILTYINAEEIYADDEFQSFLKLKEKLRKKEYTNCCKNCYVKDDCTPCSFQFSRGTIECEFVYSKIKKLLSKLEKSKVEFLTSNKVILRIQDDFLSFVYVNKDKQVKDLFLLCSNEKNINFMDFILKLREYEKKYLLKLTL